uniref:NB-ARC domain-containing protein n=1 Tax=Triticum urartu TaxID=4572 RepID=A0A8R7VC23_TRIUA
MTRFHETPHGDAPSSSTSPCYSVIGIYGVAGSGKTTFAQYIRDYIKEECKQKLFDTIMSIHVSETFSVDDIFHEMLKDITSNRHSNISDHEELEEKLKESLCGKRFFLILDDLWVKSKNDIRLEELISPLNAGIKGSTILVTARTKDAAGVLCADEPIKLPDLDEDQYLTMFMHYALGGTSVGADEFVRVGRLIANKLHRSPIAAVVVAGRLGTNPNIEFWKNIEKLDMLNDTMHALWWSYQQLNPDIRRCLEYYNIFPKRFKLTRVELVRLWIAQGFVKNSCATEDTEDVAEGYIQELVACSFLQPEGDYFTIHDLMHDLAKKVSGSDYFRIENKWIESGEGWKGDVPRDVRHLFVQNYDSEWITEKILRLEKLRTIYVVERGTLLEDKVIESICKRLPKLRVLSIDWSNQYCALENPESS